MSRKSFQRLARFITGELGIKMPEAKLSMLQSRLMRRVRQLGLGTVENYERYLFESDHAQEELVQFIDAVTTNKTDFFREPSHFEFLSRRALEEHARKNPGKPYLVWCAGCSTGEEPYTIAMVLSEYAASRPDFDYAILATDISTRVLEFAKRGIYDETRIGPIPVPLRRTCLMRGAGNAKGQFRIAPGLRRRVTFHRLNFMDAEYPVKSMFSAVFFRNVMIYFDKETQERVVNRLCRNLVSGGYLFAGHSESLSGLDIPVDFLGDAVYQRH